MPEENKTDISSPEFQTKRLFSFIDSGNIEGIKKTLAAGADVNARGHGGDTPLLCAAFDGRVDIVRLLLAHGADPQMKGRDGKLAHELAETSAVLLFQPGSHEAARLLKDALRIRQASQNAQQRQAALKKARTCPLKF